MASGLLGYADTNFKGSSSCLNRTLVSPSLGETAGMLEVEGVKVGKEQQKHSRRFGKAKARSETCAKDD